MKQVALFFFNCKRKHAVDRQTSNRQLYILRSTYYSNLLHKHVRTLSLHKIRKKLVVKKRHFQKLNKIKDTRERGVAITGLIPYSPLFGRQHSLRFSGTQLRLSGVQCGADGLKCLETTLLSSNSMIGVKLTHLGTLY